MFVTEDTRTQTGRRLINVSCRKEIEEVGQKVAMWRRWRRED